MKVLITGGAGYIGSHCAVALRDLGADTLIYDNLSTGNINNLRFSKYILGDVRDRLNLEEAIKKFKPDCIFHLAASAYVGESFLKPIDYFSNNIGSLISLLTVLKKNPVPRIIFSSSCAVYGSSEKFPVTEENSLKPISPYGYSKLVCEEMLQTFGKYTNTKIVVLRFFNAAGASETYEIGEMHFPETHLIPNSINAALGFVEFIEIFGMNHDTPDGSCIRDFIHVSDIADAHMKAIDFLDKTDSFFSVFNLGSNQPTSVLEIIKIIESISLKEIRKKIQPSRIGDPALIFASSKLANELLGWSPHNDLNAILISAFNWHNSQIYRNFFLESINGQVS
jgi:UDP-arabinose 4-epimerase